MTSLTTKDNQYAGAGGYQTIINHIRPHIMLVVPMIGPHSLSVIRHIKQAQKTFLNDFEGKLKDQGRELEEKDMQVFSQHPYEFLKELELPRLHTKVCILLDVPLSFRASGQRSSDKEGLSLHEQAELCRYLVRLSQQTKPFIDVLVSVAPDQLYQNQLSNLAGWHREEFSFQPHRAEAVIRHLYMNYAKEAIETLHDFRYYGKDYRQRESFKMKRIRFRQKLASLPPLERNMYLEVLRNNLSEQIEED